MMKDDQGLRDLIQAGASRVSKTYASEAPGHREIDSSLTFPTRTATLDADPIQDVSKNLSVLDRVEQQLTRGNGMIRYHGDSYESLNYNIAADKDGQVNPAWGELMSQFGAQDASDPAVFQARQKLGAPDQEAEWFMVSDASRAYTHQLDKLTSLLESQNRPPTSAEWGLLERAYTGATRNLNRAYARVTAPGEIKANGLPAPAWAVPEAYQKVTSLKGGAHAVAVPGVNTPLAWGESSLYAASQDYLASLEKLQALDILSALQAAAKLQG